MLIASLAISLRFYDSIFLHTYQAGRRAAMELMRDFILRKMEKREALMPFLACRHRRRALLRDESSCTFDSLERA